jgi:hypothetical protein
LITFKSMAVQAPIFTGNRNGLFFPAAEGLAALFCVVEGDFDNAVLAITEAAAMLAVMIFPAGAAVAEINRFRAGTGVFGEEEKKQQKSFHLPEV